MPTNEERGKEISISISANSTSQIAHLIDMAHELYLRDCFQGRLEVSGVGMINWRTEIQPTKEEMISQLCQRQIISELDDREVYNAETEQRTNHR